MPELALVQSGCIFMVRLHAGKKKSFAYTPMDEAQTLANKTRLVAPFYNGYTYP